MYRLHQLMSEHGPGQKEDNHSSEAATLSLGWLWRSASQGFFFFCLFFSFFLFVFIFFCLVIVRLHNRMLHIGPAVVRYATSTSIEEKNSQPHS